MRIINFNDQKGDKKIDPLKEGECVVLLNESEKAIFKRILDALPVNRKTPDMLISIEQFCANCGCTQDSPCPDGCGWAAPFKCSRCYDEEGYRIK